MLAGMTTAPAVPKVVTLTDKNTKVSGLVRLELASSDPTTRAFFARMATLNTTWNKAIPVIEKALSKVYGRPVVCLKGNFVKEKAGVVSAVSPVKLPGYVYLQRKGYDTATGKFYLWVVLK